MAGASIKELSFRQDRQSIEISDTTNIVAPLAIGQIEAVSITARDEQHRSGSNLALSEIQKLRTLLSQPHQQPSVDLDAALAQKLQAEELRIVQSRNPKSEKRKAGTLDSFFGGKRNLKNS